MSRTKRSYNRKETNGYYHPYRQVCMGHCPACKSVYVAEAKERNRALREILRSEMMCVEEESNNPYTPLKRTNPLDDLYDSIVAATLESDGETQWHAEWYVMNVVCQSTEPTLC